MCFEEEVLSAYIDGELGDEKTSTVARHLKVCEPCLNRVLTLKSLKHGLRKSVYSLDAFTHEVVWTRISHSTTAKKGLDFWHRGFVISPSLMISFSFIFLAVLGIGIFFSIPNIDNNIANTANIDFSSGKYPLDISIDNVEKVLAHFDIHDEPMEVFIQLPVPSDFVIQGEPRFLKKTDYIAGN
jgi:hypothetical protein